MSLDNKECSGLRGASGGDSAGFTDSLVRLDPGPSAPLDEFLRIYQESLPAREQKSAAQISAMLTRDDYRILILKRDELIVGFSVVFVPRDESFCLLEYMAIDSAFRNIGLGRQLFSRTVDFISASVGKIPVLLEVDSDREPAPDQSLRGRRQRFYRRLNCRRIDRLPYFLPLPGESPPPQMDLLVYFPGHLPVVHKAQLRRWLTQIYHDVYDRPVDDPQIAHMLATVPDPIEFI